MLGNERHGLEVDVLAECDDVVQVIIHIPWWSARAVYALQSKRLAQSEHVKAQHTLRQEMFLICTYTHHPRNGCVQAFAHAHELTTVRCLRLLHGAWSPQRFPLNSATSRGKFVPQSAGSHCALAKMLNCQHPKHSIRSLSLCTLHEHPCLSSMLFAQAAFYAAHAYSHVDATC